MSLQTTFCECLIYIFLGQLFRQLFLRESEQKRYIVIVTKIVIQATLPSLILRNISKLRTISKEGWFLIISYIVYSFIVYIVTFFVLYRRKPSNIRASMLCSALGVNIGLFFYPIIEAIGGSDGIALSAMADIPSTLTAFIFYPIIYDWAVKKGFENQSDKKRDPEENEGSMTTSATSSGGSGKTPTELDDDDDDDNNHHHHHHHHHHGHSHDNDHDVSKSGDGEQGSTHWGVLSNTPAQTPSPAPSNGGDDIPLKALGRKSTSFESSRPTTPTLRRVREPESIRVHIGGGEEYTELDIVFVTPEPIEFPSDTPAVRKQKRLRKIALKFIKIFTNMPIDASILGLILGPGCKVNLPTFIDNALEKMSRANTFMSMMLVGLLLNINPKALKENAFNALQAVGVRYIGGAIGGCITYFLIGPHVSDLCKTIFAVYFVLPVPVVSGTYAMEKGLDPSLPILVANLTMVCSFFVIWIITTVLPPINDSSSLLSSSYSSSALNYIS